MLEELLEEMLKENELIGDIGKHGVFKQLHSQIGLFKVGDIVSRVDEAEELIQRYQSSNLPMPAVDKNIRVIIKSLEALKSALPRHIKENYTNFSKLEKSDKEAAYHCAKEFLSYAVIGEKYAITPLWRQRKKVKQAANFIADYERTMKRKQQHLESYKQKESERLRQEREKLKQYIAQTEAEMHAERKNYQHQVALLKQRTELASIELERAKIPPHEPFCLPVYLEAIGYPNNPKLGMLWDMLQDTKPWPKRLQHFTAALSNLPPPQNSDVEYLLKIQRGLQEGLKKGSLAQEVREYQAQTIAQTALSALHTYLEKGALVQA